MMESVMKPLAHLKVVEFASVLAGPAVGMFFAELGAQVIKIENKTTGGDVTRGWKLPSEAPESPVSAYWASVNWGKTHELLDLKTPEAQAHALAAVAEADIVVSNFKPSFARRIGLDAETLCARHPRLIYAQLNAYPDPEDERPAFDIVLQAEAGFMYMNGAADGPPVRMPVALIDVLAAHQLKEAILIALLRREQSGRGGVVQTSLLESALASLVNQASNYLNAGFVPQRMGAQHPNITPYGDMLACRDGELLLLAVGTEGQFEKLCTCLNAPELLLDARFANNKQRVLHREALIDLLKPFFATKTAAEWLAVFDQNGVPAARLRDMKGVFEKPEAQAMILESQDEGQSLRRMKTVAFEITT